MARRLTQREFEALRHALGGYEDKASFPRGVGMKTINDLVARGLLEHGTCPTYGTVGWRTTKAGTQALANHRR
jgi:hypothetical protein